MVKMKAVESSNILEIGYDEPAEVLYVTFRNGMTYAYDMVPYIVYEELINAESIGQYLNNSIKGVYEYNKV